MQKHEGFVGFENTYSRAKTYVMLTSLNYVYSMQVTVDTVNFCDDLECIYAKYEKSVQQQHLNCLINTWGFTVLNMAVNSVRQGFLCDN